jgi:siroheme synthase (precorrin-2 oxidase/ferrochelatase)
MPHDIDGSRIHPLAALPLFFRLQGRAVIVAGDGPGLAWKADVLAAGARVKLVTTDSGRVQHVNRCRASRRLTLVPRA